MTHTNVQMPRRGDRERELKADLLAAEVKFWRAQAEYLANELENIPAAVEKYGYVDFPDGLKLVAAPTGAP